jgi:type II secretory pathway component PulC
MKKFIILASLAALPLVGCASYNKKPAVVAETSKDWTQRRDEFVAGSQAKLDEVYQKVVYLEKRGKLVKNSDERKAKSESKDLKEDIADLKKEINDDSKKVSAGDWEKERLDIQSDINKVEQDYSELSARYRKL